MVVVLKITDYVINGGDIVPEVRTILTVELHRKLKGDAVRKGMHLKQLIAEVLKEYVNDQMDDIIHDVPPKKRPK